MAIQMQTLQFRHRFRPWAVIVCFRMVSSDFDIGEIELSTCRWYTAESIIHTSPICVSLAVSRATVYLALYDT
jgi:hypothetical protein